MGVLATADQAAANHEQSANAPRIPDQPDGIEDDSSDLPDPQRAAERVIAYITAWGDGLIDTADRKHPLYARDLVALAEAVLSTPPTSACRVESRHGRPVVDAHLPA